MKRADAIAFAPSGLDRAAHHRTDPDAMARLAAGPEAALLPLWRGKPLFGGAPDCGLGWLPPDHAGLEAAVEPPVFLGLDDGRPRFALDLSSWEPGGSPASTLGAFHDPSEQIHPGFPDGYRFAELRARMTELAPREAEAAAAARALVMWHARHRFCANCGSPSLPAMAGWQRDCPDCGTQHYPRTDPVVIMLITRGNATLIGRSPGWPEGMYSLLAGYVEPGETIEAAVRRETAEESGIVVGPVRYLASQPWPFPASMLIACHGRAETEEITLDPAELQDARWISREEMLAVFAGRHPEIRAARRGAIARWVLQQWIAGRLREPVA